MEKTASLSLFKEMIETTKSVMYRHPTSFWRLFRGFIMDLGVVTEHVRNDDFRLMYLRLLSVRVVGSAYWDYQLQRDIKAVIEELVKSDPAELKESALYAVGKVEIEVLSDSEGRNVLNVEEIRTGLGKVVPGLDEISKTHVFSRLVTALRQVQHKFAEHGVKELENFYNALVVASEKDWSNVLAEVDKYLIKLDKESILWQRT